MHVKIGFDVLSRCFECRQKRGFKFRITVRKHFRHTFFAVIPDHNGRALFSIRISYCVDVFTKQQSRFSFVVIRTSFGSCCCVIVLNTSSTIGFIRTSVFPTITFSYKQIITVEPAVEKIHSIRIRLEIKKFRCNIRLFIDGIVKMMKSFFGRQSDSLSKIIKQAIDKNVIKMSFF